MKKIKEILIFCILVIVIGIAMATVVIKIEQKSNEDNADKENINSESTSNITPTEDALRFKKKNMKMLMARLEKRMECYLIMLIFLNKINSIYKYRRIRGYIK